MILWKIPILDRFSLILCSIASSSILLLSACSPPPPENSASNESEANNKILKLLYWQAPTLLNPHLSTGYKDAEASRITLEPLATFDKDGQLIPFLAAEIPTIENNGIAKDGKSVTWKLQKRR